MEEDKGIHPDFSEEALKLQGYLFVLEEMERKLYVLLEEHPERILLHAALALVAVSIELLSHLLELITLWK